MWNDTWFVSDAELGMSAATPENDLRVVASERALEELERTREAAAKGFLNATELADYLTRKGLPFRIAHETVGKLVLFAIEQQRELNELSIVELKKFSPVIDEDVVQVLSIDAALAAKGIYGGTAPTQGQSARQSTARHLQP